MMLMTLQCCFVMNGWSCVSVVVPPIADKTNGGKNSYMHMGCTDGIAMNR